MDYDPRDMLVSSDYPLDKIIGIQSGSLVVASGFSEAIVPHGLDFAPLARGRWSTNSNFSISYDVISGLSPLPMAVEIYTNATNLVVRGINFSGGSATLYYKVFYFMPSDVNAVALPTQSMLDNFNINTDYNYSKLLLSGTASGAGGTVSHDLGYYPQCEVWWESSDGFIRPVNEYLLGEAPYATVSQIAVSFVPDQFNNPVRWHYRIYAEEL